MVHHRVQTMRCTRNTNDSDWFTPWVRPIRIEHDHRRVQMMGESLVPRGIPPGDPNYVLSLVCSGGWSSLFHFLETKTQKNTQETVVGMTTSRRLPRVIVKLTKRVHDAIVEHHKQCLKMMFFKFYEPLPDGNMAIMTDSG